jgi:hypothetical protein
VATDPEANPFSTIDEALSHDGDGEDDDDDDDGGRVKTLAGVDPHGDETG